MAFFNLFLSIVIEVGGQEYRGDEESWPSTNLNSHNDNLKQNDSNDAEG